MTAEFDRVHPLVRCDFVQERFDGEVALYSSRRSKVDRPEEFINVMAQHARVGKFIRRRIRTSRQPVPIRISTGETPRQEVTRLAPGMTLRPLLKVECRDMTLSIQACSNVHSHGRTHRLPTVLVVPHPLDPYRSSHGLRQQCRISSRIVATQPSV